MTNDKNLEIFHQPVMVKEVLSALRVLPDSIIVDATLGAGGHAEAICEILKGKGKLIGIEWDQTQIKKAKQRLSRFGRCAVLVHDSYRQLDKILVELGIDAVNGVLFDFGLSMDQLKDRETGMSFSLDGPLDMRFNRESDCQTAADILNQASLKELKQIFHDFGDLPRAGFLAQAVVDERRKKKFVKVIDLLEVLDHWQGSRRSHHPATLVFQALRIAVNHELENIKETLPKALACLKSGGRLVTLTYHSGEDRAVKDFIKQVTPGCICPPEIPICRCSHQAIARKVKLLQDTPTPKEQQLNPASRSAHLRAIEKI